LEVEAVSAVWRVIPEQLCSMIHVAVCYPIGILLAVEREFASSLPRPASSEVSARFVTFVYHNNVARENPSPKTEDFPDRK
jgi:ABC-type polysaccharide transport system permease subunit